MLVGIDKGNLFFRKALKKFFHSSEVGREQNLHRFGADVFCYGYFISHKGGQGRSLAHRSMR